MLRSIILVVCLAQLLGSLKFVLASLSRLDCNKSALRFQWKFIAITCSVFFFICVYLHMLCIKVNRK